MVNKIVTFTTYKSDGTTLSGTPFVFGFTDKLGNNGFDNTGDYVDADLEIPPPPPPGSASTGNPISTSYIDSMYVKVSDGANDINAYQYLLDISDNSDISLNLAVRDYGGDNVVFKYKHSDISGVLGTLNITNNSWTIDLVSASVSGSGGSNPTISTDGDVRTVTLPHLANNTFYTMNLKQYVVDSGPTAVTQTISLTSVGYTWISTYLNNEPINDIKKIITDPLQNLEILSQTGQPLRYALSGVGSNKSVKWSSTAVVPFNNTQMYIVKIPSAPFNISVNATSLADDITINLDSGWTWISYPCKNTKLITDAITNPTEGDSILSQNFTSNYSLSGLGSKRGLKWSTIVTLTPGLGYKYKTLNDKQLVISST